MDIQILGMDRSSTSGKTLLRMMKNSSMSVLDILIRESIQNSLDAARPESKKVCMDFKIDSCNTTNLAREFPFIESELISRYGLLNTFLSIRDSNTTGLTGIDDMKNVNTRLQSLIYQIGKDTKAGDSGGSYGYGKTVFFRIGIGLVLYYSRIKENGRYCNLLAATLVEDEDNNPMVQKSESRGISYFGVPDPESTVSDPDRRVSIPITDDKAIKHILDLFGRPLFSDDETGTDIIIPFINPNELLDTVIRDRDSEKPKWMKSLGACISYLIQRWYAPRLSVQYGDKWLQASVNGNNPISNSYMEPSFRLVQDLYLYARNDGYSGGMPGIKKERMEIKDLKISNLPLGWIAAASVKKSLLKIDERPNWNIGTVIGRNIDSVPSCVVTYTRKPGMLIRYETEGRWCPTVTVDEDCVLFAIFVLNSALYYKELDTLEEYIRSCEQASHDHWNDESSLNIVSSIQSKVKKKIDSKFKLKEIDKKEIESGLSRFYTEAFIPPLGIGVKTKKSSPDIISKRKKRKAGLIVNSNLLKNSCRIISSEVTLGPSESIIRFVMQSETGSIESDSWESETGKDFPLIITRVMVTGVSEGRGGIVSCHHDVALDDGISTIFQDYSIRIMKTKRKIPYGLVLSGPKGFTVALEITLICDSTLLSFEIKHSLEG